MFTHKNVKIPVSSVRYECNDAMVHCFIKLDIPYDSEFNKLFNIMYSSYLLSRKEARHSQYKWCDVRNVGKSSQSKNYIYNPNNYEFHGIARLKDGDECDLKFAKTVAYKKAFRQALKFYMKSYSDMYEYLMNYVDDIWLEQICQISDKILEVEDEISELVED